MKIQLIRHATLFLEINNHRILVDPMLGPKGSMAPVQNSANNRNNPLEELPLNEDELNLVLNSIHGVLLTHTHRDHFDEVAAKLISKDIPIFCQPVDSNKLLDLGFTKVHPIDDTLNWEGIHFTRTGGRHGTGIIGKLMGPVSGYVLQFQDKSIYIAGDTIWCTEVEKTLEKFKPDMAILNAGAAQFLTGDPITMTAQDICKVCRKSPKTKVIVVHMESFNHCLLTREELKNILEEEKLTSQVCIANNGEWLSL